MSEQDEQQTVREALAQAREQGAGYEALILLAVQTMAARECECEPYGGTICRVCGAREILEEAGVTP